MCVGIIHKPTIVEHSLNRVLVARLCGGHSKAALHCSGSALGKGRPRCCMMMIWWSSDYDDIMTIRWYYDDNDAVLMITRNGSPIFGQTQIRLWWVGPLTEWILALPRSLCRRLQRHVNPTIHPRYVVDVKNIVRHFIICILRYKHTPAMTLSVHFCFVSILRKLGRHHGIKIKAVKHHSLESGALLSQPLIILIDC